MPALESLISILQQQGIFEIYLPFLLTLSIFYALLNKIRVFGDKANKINAVVAFIAALYIMVFSPAAIPISQFFALFFSQASVGIVVLLVFMMILGLLTGPFWSAENIAEIWKNIVPWALGIGFLLVIGIFISSGGISLFGRIVPPGVSMSAEDVALIVLLIVTIIVIVVLVSGGKEVEKHPGFEVVPKQKRTS